MSTTSAKPAFALNGIDATTGLPYGQPLSPEALTDAVVKEAVDPDLGEALRKRSTGAERSFAVMGGVDAGSLESAGWGVIFPFNCPQAIIDSLKPLLDHRQEQAGGRFRKYTGADGYHPQDTVLQFLSRSPRFMGTGHANPDKVPYYLLLVGGPDQIPFAFQYRLDVDYAVGRIAFATPEEYERYARSVVAQENSGKKPNSEAVLFSVANPGDDATNRGYTEMMDPLATQAAKWTNGWKPTLIAPADATKQRIFDLFHAGEAPGIFFSSSHGLGFPTGHQLQERRQGAILCRNWPGPFQHKGPIPEDWYFSGDDLDAKANVKGTVAFLFACYSGGTPARDYFPETGTIAEKQIAPHDLFAHLPLRMLTHDRGSARAVVAHVERVWTCSFSWPGAGPQVEPFQEMLQQLTAGAPLGLAMEAFGAKYASLNVDLTDVTDLLRVDANFKPDPDALSRLWTARNDARSFIILGDPAVRAV